MSEEKKRELTQEEFDKYVAVHEGEWGVEPVHGFYARLKDGKVTVPKEIMEKLKLEDDQFLRLHVSEA